MDVITADDLAEQGSPSVLQLVKSLPVVGGIVLGDSNQFVAGAQGQVGAGSINLRGIGANRTLFLMNGRRTAVSPGGASPNTNLLPIAAIGRVEILKDGAAATYGSDAMGGVVNFITRRDVEGLEVHGQYLTPESGGNGDYEVSANWGWRGDRSNVLFSVGYQHRDEIQAQEPGWAFQDYAVNNAGWSTSSTPGAWLPVAGAAPPAGSAYVATAAGAPVGGFRRDSNCAAFNGVPTNLNGSSTLPVCAFSYVPFDNLVEEQRQTQVYFEANSELGDDLDLHFEALYAKIDVPEFSSSPGYAPTVAPFPGMRWFVPNANPGVAAFLAQTGSAPAPAGGGWATQLGFWRPFGFGGNPIGITDGDNDAQDSSRDYNLFRFSGSLAGDFSNGIGWETAITYSWNEYVTAGRGDILVDRLQASLEGFGGPNCDSSPLPGIQPGAGPGLSAGGFTCLWYNPFTNALPGSPRFDLTNPGYIAPPANTNTRELWEWLQPYQSQTQEADLMVFDAVLNGEFFELGGGPIGWAAGAQWRRSTYTNKLLNPLANADANPCILEGDTSCGQLTRTGVFIFLGNSRPLDLEQSVYAVFGELNLPITDNLNVQAALRHEEYGGETGSTTNPKLSVRWQVFDSLALRGSIGTTFRGPTAGNLSPNFATGLAPFTATNNQFRSVDFYGNPSVEPETATTWSAGFIFEMGGFRAIVDYWNYDIEDPIVFVPATAIVAQVANNGAAATTNCGSPFAPLVTFATGPCVNGVSLGADIARVRSDTVNGPATTVNGVDFQFDYGMEDVLGGSLSLGLGGSYIDEYSIDAFSFLGATLEGPRQVAGTASYNRAPGPVSQWRGNLFANYNRGPVNIRYEWQYIDGLFDERAPGVIPVGATVGGCTLPAHVNGTTCLLNTYGWPNIDSWSSHSVHLVWELPWDTTLAASITNIGNEDPSKTRTEYGYDPAVGNPLGRTFEIGLRKRF